MPDFARAVKGMHLPAVKDDRTRRCCKYVFGALVPASMGSHEVHGSVDVRNDG